MRELAEYSASKGLKLWVTTARGKHFNLAGHIIDYANHGGWPTREQAATWHAIGSKVASYAGPHTGPENPTKAAVLIVTSDRGLAGAYSSSVLKEAERLIEKLKEEGKEVDVYISGRKGEAYFKFRNRPIAASWTGHSDQPTYDVASEIGDALIQAFLAGADAEGSGAEIELAEGASPVDEVHVVYTRFRSMLIQEPTAVRLLPLEVVEGTEPPEEGDPIEGRLAGGGLDFSVCHVVKRPRCGRWMSLPASSTLRVSGGQTYAWKMLRSFPPYGASRRAKGFVAVAVQKLPDDSVSSPLQEAERRHCAGGREAWTPSEERRGRDAPS